MLIILLGHVHQLVQLQPLLMIVQKNVLPYVHKFQVFMHLIIEHVYQDALIYILAKMLQEHV